MYIRKQFYLKQNLKENGGKTLIYSGFLGFTKDMLSSNSKNIEDEDKPQL